jgi:hypothetical protein
MRKAIKFCLALAMVGTLAIPAYSADVETKITGRARGTLIQKSFKNKVGDDNNVAETESVSYMDMSADGRLGHQLDIKGEKWNTTSKIEFAVSESSVTPRDIKVQVHNDDMNISVGRQYVTGVALGEDYTSPVSYTEGAGEHVIAERFSSVRLALNNVGLDVFYGMDEVNDDDTANDQYNRSRLGVLYSNTFGDLELGATYVTYTDTINKDNDGLEKGAADGRTASEAALAVRYAMGKMAFALNYSSWSTKDGGDDAETLNNNSMDLIFDMEMDGMLDGVSVAYTMASNDKMVGSDKEKNDKTAFVVGTAMSVGEATLYIGYASQSIKGSESGSETATESEFGTRLHYGF